MTAQTIAQIRAAQRVLVTMHAKPDGDALGSSLAVACALRELGKEVVHYNPDPVPFHFAFLPGASHIVDRLSPDDRFDLCVVCDTSRLSRLGPDLPSAEARGVTLTLDHHGAREPFAELELVDEEAAAVGVLVWRLLEAMGHPVSRDVALGIYTSILTDTGSFRYNSTNPEALRVAAALIELGVSPWEVASQVYEAQPAEKVRLLGQVLSTIEFAYDGRLAVLEASRQTLEELGASVEMLDGMVNHARGVMGVEVAVLVAETDENACKAIFRSRGRVDLLPLAQQVGARAMPNAASVVLTANLPGAKQAAAQAVGTLFGAPAAQAQA